MLRLATSIPAWLALLAVLAIGDTLALQSQTAPGATSSQVLTSTAVTRSAVTTDGRPVGSVRVTVALLREPSGVRLQATWTYDLPFPAVANGQLTVSGHDGQLLARGNPRQLVTLRADGPQDTLTTPFVQMPVEGQGELCGQADLNVWYDFKTSPASVPAPNTPAMTPTIFHVKVCTSDK